KVGHHEIGEEIIEVVLEPAGGKFPALGGVQLEGGDADVDIVVVLKNDDILGVGNVAAQFRQHGNGHTVMPAGSNIVTPIDPSVETGLGGREAGGKHQQTGE